ncbi:hypothetical protein B0O99DRAFT_639916 [Bisporella sp. PMI_857]|nr:hypothetical protein B0O99DRAFT_639916 [Bisporella sp. PMI_857]
MAAFIAKIISKKILGETLQNNFGKEDPYFETVPATRLDGKPHKSKTVKRRKALPAGLSEHDGKVLTKVKRRAYRLDMSLFSFFGVRFGWSSVIGIIPAIGDVIDAFMAVMVLRTCQQIEGGLPASVKSKMFINIIIDFAVGLVPFVGDLVDAVFRANTKNAILLEDYLRKKGQESLKAQGRPVPAIDPSDPVEFDKQENPPAYTTAPPSRNGTQRQGGTHGTSSSSPPAQPAQAAPQESRGGWFGFGKKTKQPDVERTGELRRDERLPARPEPTVTRGQSTRLQKSSRS